MIMIHERLALIKFNCTHFHVLCGSLLALDSLIELLITWLACYLDCLLGLFGREGKGMKHYMYTA